MPVNTKFDPLHFSEYTKKKLNKSTKSVAGTAQENQITNFDLFITDDVCLSGSSLLIDGAVKGDKVSFQILAPNPQGGDPIVALTIVDSWYVDWTKVSQEVPKSEYPAKIAAGLTLRLKFEHGAGSTAWLAINFNLEKVLA